MLLHLLYNALLRSESRIVTLNHSSKLHFIILYLNFLPENINNYLMKFPRAACVEKVVQEKGLFIASMTN